MEIPEGATVTLVNSPRFAGIGKILGPSDRYSGSLLVRWDHDKPNDPLLSYGPEQLLVICWTGNVRSFHDTPGLAYGCEECPYQFSCLAGRQP